MFRLDILTYTIILAILMTVQNNDIGIVGTVVSTSQIIIPLHPNFCPINATDYETFMDSQLTPEIFICNTITDFQSLLVFKIKCPFFIFSHTGTHEMYGLSRSGFYMRIFHLLVYICMSLFRCISYYQEVHFLRYYLQCKKYVPSRQQHTQVFSNL